jgi:ankyrin repeat protein
MSLLYAIAAACSPDALAQQLKDQPDVNCRTLLSGFTPLHIAVSGLASDSPERRQIIRLLHLAGADLEAKSRDKGFTPLHLAVLCDRPVCVAALLDCGADIHATDFTGTTALHGAAFHGLIGLIDILLRAGARPDQANHQGDTPISLARDRGHLEIAHRLEESLHLMQSRARQSPMAADRTGT